MAAGEAVVEVVVVVGDMEGVEEEEVEEAHFMIVVVAIVSL